MIMSEDYRQRLITRLRGKFEFFGNPPQILHLFHQYDENVLTKRDMEKVNALTEQKGPTAGATELLDRLCRYKGFFRCLMKVFRDRDVKLGHVAEQMERIKRALDNSLKEDVEDKESDEDEEINNEEEKRQRMEKEIQQLKEMGSQKDQENLEKSSQIAKLTQEKRDCEIQNLTLGFQLEMTVKDQELFQLRQQSLKRKMSEDVVLHDSAKKTKRLQGALSMRTWCSCHHCAILPHFKEEDLLCCREVPEVKEKLKVGTHCVTMQIYFRTVILNEEELKEEFEDCTGEDLRDPLQSRNLRYAAYRVFIRWIYDVLGAGDRRVIPACAVAAIHSKYPF